MMYWLSRDVYDSRSYDASSYDDWEMVEHESNCETERESFSSVGSEIHIDYISEQVSDITLSNSESKFTYRDAVLKDLDKVIAERNEAEIKVIAKRNDWKPIIVVEDIPKAVPETCPFVAFDPYYDSGGGMWDLVDAVENYKHSHAVTRVRAIHRLKPQQQYQKSRRILAKTVV